MSFKVHVEPSGHEFNVEAGESILDAAIRQGINIPYGCRNGFCGSCQSALLAGDIDYILKVQVPNARAYDRFYQALISEVRIHNVTALLSMEEIKSTTALPLGV